MPVQFINLANNHCHNSSVHVSSYVASIFLSRQRAVERSLNIESRKAGEI